MSNIESKNFIRNKQNTVIFVENSLFVSGIYSILSSNQMDVIKMNIEDINNNDHQNLLIISQVINHEMELAAQKILENDSTTNIIIIKNNFDMNEIERFIDIGVKGLCLADIDEPYLINTIKDVRKGRIIVDHRFTNLIVNEYKLIKKLQAEVIPLDPSALQALLTRREFEILLLISKGYSNNQIGYELVISDKTVKNHVSKILEKMEVPDRLNAVLKSVKNNWISIG